MCKNVVKVNKKISTKMTNMPNIHQINFVRLIKYSTEIKI
jgi:hypothetical protein